MLDCATTRTVLSTHDFPRYQYHLSARYVYQAKQLTLQWRARNPDQKDTSARLVFRLVLQARGMISTSDSL